MAICQSGSGIPAGDADYIIGQVNALIAALNNGIVVCCKSAPRPGNPVQGTLVNPYQLQANPNPYVLLSGGMPGDKRQAPCKGQAGSYRFALCFWG